MMGRTYDRWRHLVHEMAKFGIVGAVNTVLDFGLANLLYLGLGWPSLGSKTASVAVAATSSYFMNRHWTFRHRARTGLRREYTLFFLLNGVGLLISDACILIVERGFGRTGALWFNLAQVAGLALGMVFRFTTYKRWVFVSPERAAARAVAEGSVAELDDEDPAQPATSRTFQTSASIASASPRRRTLLPWRSSAVTGTSTTSRPRRLATSRASASKANPSTLARWNNASAALRRKPLSPHWVSEKGRPSSSRMTRLKTGLASRRSGEPPPGWLPRRAPMATGARSRAATTRSICSGP